MATKLLVEIELQAHTVAIRNATKKRQQKCLHHGQSPFRVLTLLQDISTVEETWRCNNPLCLISHTGFGPYPPSKIISSVQNPDFEILFPQQMCRKGMMRPRNGQVIMHSPMLFLPPCRITRIVKAATDYIVYIG
jgi:hypothetical protein